MDHCDACGFVYADLELDDLPTALRAAPPRYQETLRRAQAQGLERRRPRPGTWSALEYTCHLRDMLRVQRERLGLALEQQQPTFAPMGRDQRAVDDHYNEQDVTAVLGELEAAAAELASFLERLDAAEWRRTCVYTWPETAVRDLAWVGRHTVHEAVHHLDDITRGLDRLERGNS